jgi:hypothetical protein
MIHESQQKLLEKPFLSSNYMKKQIKSPIKGASIRMNRAKINNKFSGFNNKISRNIQKFNLSENQNDQKKGYKLVIYNLKISVKTIINQINKIEQLVYDFKVMFYEKINLKIKKMKQLSKVENIFSVEYYPNNLRRAYQNKFTPKSENPLHLKKSFSYKKFDLKNTNKKKHHMTDYLNRKALSSLFNEQIGDNALLVVGLSGNISLLMDKSLLVRAQLVNLVPGLPNFEDIIIEKMDLTSITYKNKNHIHEEDHSMKGILFSIPKIEVSLKKKMDFPILKDEFFWMIFEISKQVFDRETFWSIIRDLFDNQVYRPSYPVMSQKENSKLKSQFSLFSNSTKELIMGYFCFLLTFEYFKSEIFK